MANHALGNNPPNSQIDINTHSSDWLWTVFAIMLLSDFGFIFWAFSRPIGQRVFHHLPIVILTVASIAYFSMASDLGSTPILAQFIRNGWTTRPTRAIWYVRYIDWTITTPLLLLELLLATGLPLSDIVTVIFMDLSMIVTGLVGALVSSSYKWGYFAIGCGCMVYIWSILLVAARKSARNVGVEAGSAYWTSALYLTTIWLLYPIAWGLADGGNVISPTGEMVWYGVLDILAKPIFCFIHVWSLRRIPYEAYALQSGKSSVGVLNANQGFAAGGGPKAGYAGDGYGNNGVGGVNNGVNKTGIPGNGTGGGVVNRDGNAAVGTGAGRV